MNLKKNLKFIKSGFSIYACGWNDEVTAHSIMQAATTKVARADTCHQVTGYKVTEAVELKHRYFKAGM